MKDRSIENLVFVCFSNPFEDASKNLQNVDYHHADWTYILKKAEQNKTTLVLLKNLLSIDRGLPEDTVEKLRVFLDNEEKSFDSWIHALSSTLSIFNEESPRLNYLLIKSLRGYPHRSVDLDFLLQGKKSLIGARNALRRKGCKISTADDKNKSFCLLDLGVESVEIDLYSEITWRNLKLTFFDQKEMWLRRRKTIFAEMEIPTPSNEDEVLITSAHSFFGHHYYFLGDLFYLQSVLSKGIDLQYAAKASKKFGWSLALYSFLQYSNILYQRVYNRNIVEDEVLDRIFNSDRAFIHLVDSFLYKWSTLRFPSRYPLILEFLAIPEKSVSSLKRDGLSVMLKETVTLTIDTVHSVMSHVYITLISLLK